MLAVTPAHAAGAVDITITNPGGQSATLAGAFTYSSGLAVDSISPSTGPASGGTLVTLTGTGFQSGVTVFFRGSDFAITATFVSSTQIQVATPAHVTGTWDVVVTNPGGASVTVTNGFVFHPAVTSVSPTSGPPAGGTSVTINGAGFRGDSSVSFGGVNATSLSFLSSSQLQAVTPAHAAGAVDVTVTNPDGTSGSLVNGFTYSGISVTGVSPSSGSTAGGTAITISGTGFESGATVTLGGVAATSVVFNSSTQIQAVSPAHAAGSVSITVTNPGGASATLSSAFTYVAGLSVGAVSPSSGPTTGGTVLTITGTGFVSGATVSFGIGFQPAASVTFISSTQLQATTPASNPDTVNVNVTNPNGETATLLNAFSFVSAIVISSVSPASGTTAGGTTVTVNGTSFLSGASVSFGGTNAASVSFVNSTQLTAVTPAHAAGPVEVRVTNPSGEFASLPNGFTYVGPVVVSSVSPNKGVVTGATAITITGSSFEPGATVSLGGTAATSVAFVSATQLQAVTPAHAAGAVNVVVTNPGGASGSLANGFTYNAVMTVSSVTPNSGLNTGGETVAVLGSGFQPGSSVFFGDAGAVSATFVDSTRLDGLTPAQAFTGLVNVSVATPDSQASTLNSAFEYVASKSSTTGPVVSSISPQSGPQTGGTALTVTGTGFQSGLSLTLGGTAATAVNVPSGAQISATSPNHSAGVVDVQVTNPDGGTNTLFNTYTYVGVTITSLTPAVADVAGGTVIQISGSGFQNGASVTLGGLLAAVAFISSGELHATAPAHAAGPVDVVVTNPDGTSKTLVQGLTYGSPPRISNIEPNSGVSTGGTTVVITGVGFEAGASVSFGGTASTAVTVNSNTQITVVAPAHATGIVNVQVTNLTGSTATQVGGFRYGTLLFQDGFESGNLSAYDAIVNTTDVTVNSDPAFVRSGAKSAKIDYQLCTDGSNPACGFSVQDRNRWFEKDFTAANGFPNGLLKSNIRGYVFIKSPGAGSSTTVNHQRKFYYLKAPTPVPGTPNYHWAVVLTSDAVNGKMGLRFIIEPHLGNIPSYSLYGGSNELGNKTNVVNGIFELLFDRWYQIEVEVQAKSAAGANDSVIKMWIDGVLVYKKTNTWTAGTCSPGSFEVCPAFPGDQVFNIGLTRFEIGTQTNRYNFTLINELRYWDDIAIADVFIGP